jgi:hypothetical protein
MNLMHLRTTEEDVGLMMGWWKELENSSQKNQTPVRTQIQYPMAESLHCN